MITRKPGPASSHLVNVVSAMLKSLLPQYTPTNIGSVQVYVYGDRVFLLKLIGRRNFSPEFELGFRSYFDIFGKSVALVIVHLFIVIEFTNNPSIDDNLCLEFVKNSRDTNSKLLNSVIEMGAKARSLGTKLFSVSGEKVAFKAEIPIGAQGPVRKGPKRDDT